MNQPAIVMNRHRGQLKNGVDLHRLHAGGAEEIAAAHRRTHRGRHTIRAGVAIMMGIAEQPVALIEQAVVDAPSIHADSGGKLVVKSIPLPEAVLDFGPDAQHIPIEISAYAHAGIGETVRLVEREAISIPAAIHHPAARCAQVHGHEAHTRTHTALPELRETVRFILQRGATGKATP